MQVKLIVFPNEDGFNVLLWQTDAKGSMRVRTFGDRGTMIAALETIRLISSKEARQLEDLSFMDSCPLYTSEIDEPTLVAHGFEVAS